MEEREEQILADSSMLFMRFGVKSLTMDDIAKQLRISKKTLYKFVSDKADLVKRCMLQSCVEDQEQVGKILKQKGNAIDLLFEVSEFVIKRLANVHPAIFFDLEKYHPEAMRVFDSHREDFIASTITKNMQKGVDEGLFRNDMNISIVTKIYLNSINQALHGTLFNNNDYSVSDIYKELFIYHVRGIASEKGLKYLNDKISKEKSQG